MILPKFVVDHRGIEPLTSRLRTPDLQIANLALSQLS